MFNLFLEFLPLIILIVIDLWVIYKSALEQARTREQLDRFHKSLRQIIHNLENKMDGRRGND